MVNAVAVTPDGRRAVSASADGTLKVWELESGRELQTLKGHAYGVNAVAVTPDGRRAVSASADQTLKVWELESGAAIATFSCDASAQCCAVANDSTIVAGDQGGRIHILALER
jgi:WD40 repeat protein